MAKRMTIESLGTYGVGGDYSPSYALASKPDKGVRKQATPFWSCRDYINDSMIAFVNKDEASYTGSYSSYDPLKGPALDFDSLRLLIVSPKDKKDNIFCAKRLLNIYETMAGFKKRSVISTIDYTGKFSMKGGEMYMLTGPEEWMRCSQLTSMVTLIIRIVWRSKELTKATTPADLNKYWENLITMTNDAHNFGRDFLVQDLETYLPTCYTMWPKMMKDFYKIFDLSREEFFPVSKVKRWHGAGGVYHLCRGATGIKKLDERIKALGAEGVKKASTVRKELKKA